MKIFTQIVMTGVLLIAATASAQDKAAADDLIIAQDGKTTTQIVVSNDAGPHEKMAASDLQKYIALMSGAKPEIVAVAAGNGAQIFVGKAALKAQPDLQAALDKVAKKNPTLRADAIVARREGNRVLLAGTNDEAHYYAASWLLQNWGIRWYLPGEIGEVVPDKKTLSVGNLNFVYAPPFEVRNYWLAWNGDYAGGAEFKTRNMMNDLSVPVGHEPGLSGQVGELIPAGKSVFNVPLAEEKTMDHVAKKIEPMFAKNEDITLGMADGVYTSDSPRDKEIQGGLFDKYNRAQMLTDNFMMLYNGVAERLLKQHPQSKSKIGFLAYTKITIPPQRVQKAASPLVAYLAPIDIDPNHGIDDPNSPPRQEYGAMMKRWAQVMDGRVVIYDYDQGMLVWRDLPNPSLQAFREDVKQYRDAKILGVATESRGALATTFTNIFWRAQLMWNPDADIAKMQDEFYSGFYGPAAAPMKTYWSAIDDAWTRTIVTEHEYMAAPAIYIPQLMARLKTALEAAEKLVPAQAKAGATRNEKLYAQRMAFARASFDVTELYIGMVNAAAGESDFKKATQLGEAALAARLKLANLNPTFTTRVIGVLPENEATGAAWFPGEVAQYRGYRDLTDGTKGTMIAKTPLEWAFHRDPNDTGLARGWAYNPVDLTYWNANKAKLTLENRKDYPTTQWEMLRTDLYAQAQGVRHPDAQSYTGFGWYRTSLTLKPEQTKGKVRLMFPGLFNECWLYVNGALVAHRPFPEMWWLSDYKFEWDVDVAGVLQPGENTVTLRFDNPHHFGGIFRRPFLYRAKN